MPVPQPSTMASKRFCLMYSLRKAAHSMVWMSVWTPISFSRSWMISAIFFRSSLPWLVRIVKLKGWPSLLRRMPSPFLSVHPAAARSCLAFAGSYG